MKNKGLGQSTFFVKIIFCNFNFKTPLLLKSCPIFYELLILWDLLNEWVAEGVASNTYGYCGSLGKITEP